MGGYTLPFGVLGGVLLSQAALSTLTLPSLKQTDRQEEAGRPGLLQALQIPAVSLAALSVFSGSVAVGALQVRLFVAV